MQKNALERLIFIVLISFFALTSSQAQTYGAVTIKNLSLQPSMPEPGQEVMLRVELILHRPLEENRIRLLDVFGKEIASQKIPEDFTSEGYIDIPFIAPPQEGRYNYNVRVSIGTENRFINVPVSSESVISAVVDDLSVEFEGGRLRLYFLVKNSGNRTIQDIRLSGMINPGIGNLLDKDIQEVAAGEELITSLKRGAAVRIGMDVPLDNGDWLLGKRRDTFWVGIRVSGFRGRPYWKVQKYTVEDGVSVPVPLHWQEAHTFYTERAIEYFPASSPLYQELDLYRQHLIDGSFKEDEYPDLVYDESFPLLTIHHFLDYDNHPFYSGLYGTGLHIPLLTSEYVESAYEKAMAYWDGWTLNSVYYPGVVELYLGIGLPFPDKITAYEYLGRITHLIEDMLTPSHVHSDLHGIPFDDDEFEEVFEPGIDPATGKPRYDKYDENSVVWAYWRDYIGNRNILDLAELFTKMNQHADYFPSDDYEGDDLNFSNPWNIPKLYTSDIIYYDIFGFDHFSLPGMQKLADWISPLNVMSCASIYKYFWDNTH
jgi:hypothetical protein